MNNHRRNPTTSPEQPANYNQFPFNRSAAARKKKKKPRSAETTEETTTSRNEAREKKRETEERPTPPTQIPDSVFFFSFRFLFFLSGVRTFLVPLVEPLRFPSQDPITSGAPTLRARWTPFIFDAPFCSSRHIGLSYCFLGSLSFPVLFVSASR